MTARTLTSPRVAARSYQRLELEHADGRQTTLHVAAFDRALVRLRVASLSPSATLLGAAREFGWRHAVVGGFFVRPEGIPLGELRIGGRPQPSIPFASPWDGRRACLQAAGASVRIGLRGELAPEPAGDLLQAGPLLVRDGVPVFDPSADDEGFSAGFHQFDSDITQGRYPRTALGVADDRILAVVGDGRSSREAGLTLAELAAAMADLGAEAAINLDGGGSASLLYGGRLRNKPREEHGIEILGGRPIATAIVFQPADRLFAWPGSARSIPPVRRLRRFGRSSQRRTRRPRSSSSGATTPGS